MNREKLRSLSLENEAQAGFDDSISVGTIDISVVSVPFKRRVGGI